jgi:hypothetical protein
MHQKRPVGLEHQQPNSLRKPGREAAGVEDFAAGDDEAHDRGPYCPFRTSR